MFALGWFAVAGCDRAGRAVEADAARVEVVAVADSELLRTIVSSADERGNALGVLRGRVEKGEFGGDEAVSTELLESSVPVLIDELDGVWSEDAWTVLIAIQGACLPREKEEWVKWWRENKAEVFWTYAHQAAKPEGQQTGGYGGEKRSDSIQGSGLPKK